MTHQEARKLIESHPDFIYMKRFEYSLDKFLDRYPDGAPTRIIAQALMITEDEVEQIYESVIQKLRQAMKIE